MNKIFKLSIVTALSGFLLVGCSMGSNSPEESSSVESHGTKVHAHLTQEKLAHIVQKAGEESGWKMTEFKSDTFIAEKTDDDETVSATVKFSNTSLEIIPENDDLEDAIKDALAK